MKLSPTYRADIDGLRAIAVLSVVIYHAFPSLLPGGFTGVDIFFVISGFLITTILLGEADQSRYDIKGFYSRRIKRIFPALAVVLLTSLTIGWFALFPQEFAQLGKHVLAGTLFVSNLVFWSEAGYFDTASKSKPLLHLWSLGIEEQFYIIWPIIIFGIARWRRLSPAIILAVILSSFLLCLSYLAQGSSSSAFYLPASRVWELAAGGLLASVVTERGLQIMKWPMVVRTLISLGGVTLLGVGLMFAREGGAFPGWWAWLPTMGTMLIILAGPTTFLNRAVLGNRVSTFFGLISYPLYLWHWPLLVFGTTLINESRSTRLAAILLSFGLAWATYRFIEQRVRLRSGWYTQPGPWMGSMMVVAVAGLIVFQSGGLVGTGIRTGEKVNFIEYFNNSLPNQPYFQKINVRNNYRTDCDFYDLAAFRDGRESRLPVKINTQCIATAPGQRLLLLWGDSHAQQFYAGLKKELPKNWAIRIVASSGCKPALVLVDSPIDYCLRSNYTALTAATRLKPDVVLIGQNGGHNYEQMMQLSNQLKKRGIARVLFAGPVPHWTQDLPKLIVRELWHEKPQYTNVGLKPDVLEANQALKTQFAQLTANNYLDVIGTLCTNQACLTRIGTDARLGITTWDYGHLTPVASAYVARHLIVPVVLETSKE